MELDGIPELKTNDALFKGGNDWWYNAHVEKASMDALATAYSDACDAVVKEAMKEDSLQDSLVYPALFLFRHFVEVQLKSIISIGSHIEGRRTKIPTHHDLLVLWKEAKKTIRIEWPTSVEKEMEALDKHIISLNTIDPLSMAFRYSTSKACQEFVRSGA